MSVLVLDEESMGILIQYHGKKEGVEVIINNPVNIDKYKAIIVDPLNYDINPYLNIIKNQDLIVYSIIKPSFSHNEYINKSGSIAEIKKILRKYVEFNSKSFN